MKTDGDCMSSASQVEKLLLRPEGFFKDNKMLESHGLLSGPTLKANVSDTRASLKNQTF